MQKINQTPLLLKMDRSKQLRVKSPLCINGLKLFKKDVYRCLHISLCVFYRFFHWDCIDSAWKIYHLSLHDRKGTLWYVRLAKTQTSLHIRAFWPQPTLSALHRKLIEDWSDCVHVQADLNLDLRHCHRVHFLSFRVVYFKGMGSVCQDLHFLSLSADCRLHCIHLDPNRLTPVSSD